jgi:hypothetical protein
MKCAKPVKDFESADFAGRLHAAEPDPYGHLDALCDGKRSATDPMNRRDKIKMTSAVPLVGRHLLSPGAAAASPTDGSGQRTNRLGRVFSATTGIVWHAFRRRSVQILDATENARG